MNHDENESQAPVRVSASHRPSPRTADDGSVSTNLSERTAESVNRSGCIGGGVSKAGSCSLTVARGLVCLFVLFSLFSLLVAVVLI